MTCPRGSFLHVLAYGRRLKLRHEFSVVSLYNRLRKRDSLIGIFRRLLLRLGVARHAEPIVNFFLRGNVSFSKNLVIEVLEHASGVILLRSRLQVTELLQFIAALHTNEFV